MPWTLVIQPDCDFAHLVDLLRPFGWEVATRAASPIIPGEPEHVLFERAQQRLSYRFNPVCRLRLLEWSEEIDDRSLAALPVATSRDLNDWLRSRDERALLRGILAAPHLPDEGLLALVRELQSHPRSTIARAAEQACWEIESALGAEPGYGVQDMPHPGSPRVVAGARWGFAAAERSNAPDRRPSEGDPLTRFRLELRRGLAECGTGEDLSGAHARLLRAMELGAALALARVVAGRGTGFVVERRPGEGEDAAEAIRLQAGDNGFGWPDWLDAFSLALLVGNARALAVLATAGCVDACSSPFERVDRFWPLLCGGLAALWQQDSAAVGLLDDAERLLERVSLLDSARASALIAPLVPLAKAIAEGNEGEVAQSAMVALEDRRDWLAAQPEGICDRDVPFALPASALLAEAERRGTRSVPHSENRLAPFSASLPDSELVVVYPRLAILNAVEAEWLLASEGFTRHDRSTVLQSADGRLVARYRAYDAPGIPEAELELELLDAKRDRIFDGSHAPPALDVGELLHRAEQLASEARPGRGGEPVYDLDQAVEAMDLALTYVDAMPSGFDPATLHSTVGERMWREEPGRFRSERMLVYRNALARQAGHQERISKPASGLVGPEARAAVGHLGAGSGKTEQKLPEVSVPDDPQEQARGLAEALTPLVLPFLQSIAMDQDGSAIRELLPRDGDYALVFTGEAVAAAREHYGTEWPRQLAEWRGPSVDPDWRIEAHLAPAGMLASSNALSRPFPGGYRQIAHWLDPRRVWVCWKYLPPGATAGIAMNGLVWIDDHWAWFPKPYRLADMLRRH